MVDTPNTGIPLALRTYNVLSTALTPFLHIAKPLLSLYGGFKDTVPERLGKFSPDIDSVMATRGSKPLVWIHAVSVGEASVAKVLVDAIKSRRPDCMVAISVTTFTGRDYILRNFSPDLMFFFPLDLHHVMRRLIGKLNPDCFLDIEIELWPNLFRALKNAGIPMALANGRISDRAARPPWIARGMYRWLFSSLDSLFMRSSEDVERAIALGAPSKKTHLSGNLKFASCGKPPSDEERRKIRDLLGLVNNAKLLVAGSTHPGEDEQIIDAWRKLNGGMLPENTDPVHLVLAPRHLEQVERISGLVKATGEKVELWTDIRDRGGITTGTRAVVVNTIGELMKLYGAADAAFVGGSLVQRGGHNVLEPVAAGVPTMHGESMANFHDLKKVLDRDGLIYEVKNAEDLARKTAQIFHDVNRAEFVFKAEKVISGQMQAQDMIADWVVKQLG